MKYLWTALFFFLSSAIAQQQSAADSQANSEVSTPPAPAMEHYRVGSDSNYAPFQFRDGEQNIIGFEPDLLKLIGEKENFTIEFEYYPRGQWQDRLDDGSVDIFSSALGISPKRTAVAEMSDPFLSYEEAVYIMDTPANSNLQTITDVVGLRFVGIKSSSGSISKPKELNDGSNVVVNAEASSIFHALREVWAGHADAVLNNNRIFQYYGDKYPQFRYRLITFEPNSPPRQFGFAVRKGRTDLRDKINAGLAKVKADGSLERLFHKWFGNNAQP